MITTSLNQLNGAAEKNKKSYDAIFQPYIPPPPTPPPVFAVSHYQRLRGSLQSRREEIAISARIMSNITTQRKAALSQPRGQIRNRSNTSDDMSSTPLKRLRLSPFEIPSVRFCYPNDLVQSPTPRSEIRQREGFYAPPTPYPGRARNPQIALAGFRRSNHEETDLGGERGVVMRPLSVSEQDPPPPYS